MFGCFDTVPVLLVFLLSLNRWTSSLCDTNGSPFSDSALPDQIWRRGKEAGISVHLTAAQVKPHCGSFFLVQIQSCFSLLPERRKCLI